MKLIKHSASPIFGPIGYNPPVEEGGPNKNDLLNDVYRQINMIGILCNDKSQTWDICNHGAVYLRRTHPETKWSNEWLYKYKNNHYSRVRNDNNGYSLNVTTNYRTLLEHGWTEDIEYICSPTKDHEKMVSVRFGTDRNTAITLMDNDLFFITTQKDRILERDIYFIQPNWISDENLNAYEPSSSVKEFVEGLEIAENKYFEIIDCGVEHEEAVNILPTALHTEFVMTGFVSNWIKFFTPIEKYSDTVRLNIIEPLIEKFKGYGYM